MRSRCLWRKASQRLSGSEVLGARFIQRETVRSVTSNPSMRSSPWMRGAPQVGPSATMRKMRSRTSLDVCLLPTRLLTLEMNLQYSRKPARCQRTTVSGVTMRRHCLQPDQTPRATTQKSLSKMPRLGRGWRRFSTASCWRKARFSRRRLRCVRKSRISVPNQSLLYRGMTSTYTGMLVIRWQLSYIKLGRSFGERHQGTGLPLYGRMDCNEIDNSKGIKRQGYGLGPARICFKRSMLPAKTPPNFR